MAQCAAVRAGSDGAGDALRIDAAEVRYRKVVFSGFEIEVVEADAGFEAHCSALRVDGEDPVEVVEVDHP